MILPIAQALGAFGGFTFSWQHRGPYSPSLDRMLYDADRAGALGHTANLSPRAKSAAKKIKSLMGRHLGMPRSLELYASVWYLLPRPRATDHDAARVVSTMEDEKPHFDKKAVRACINTISKFRMSS